MAYNVAGLSAYTDQNNLKLIHKSIFEAKFLKMLTPMTGVKSAEAVNILETDAVFQSGAACGWTPSGTTSFTQRVLTVGRIKINEATCPRDLELYYTQMALQKGSYLDEMPFEEIYTDEKSEKIAAQLEIAALYGDVNDTRANWNQFDGLLKIIDASGQAITAYPGTNNAIITSSNVLAIFDEIYLNIPAALLNTKDFTVFCGWDVFRTWTTALKNANLFHYDPGTAAADGELIIPGSNVKVVAINGLNLSNASTSSTGGAQSSTVSRIIGMRLSRSFYGTDLENDAEAFKIWYSEDFDEIRFRMECKAGVQVAFPFEIVQYGV